MYFQTKEGADGGPIEKQFPYVFSENGLVAFKVFLFIIQKFVNRVHDPSFFGSQF